MIRIVIILILSFYFLIITGQRAVPVYNFDSFEPILNKKNDTVYLINFWATWCAPCRKELPEIEAIGEKFNDRKFKIILVSLDMSETLNKTLYPFLKNNDIKSEVVVLDDVHSNVWINKVDSSWQGSIPATLIFSKEKRIFIEKPVNFQYLDSLLIKHFNL